MIAGTVVLDDIIINFACDHDHQCHFSVVDTLNGIVEELAGDQEKFLKALFIAIHNDGTPDYNADYADAESIQGDIRWIP